MKFKIDFDISSPPEKINIRHTLLLTGSCFAEHIGKKLEQNKFQITINPNGIIFNPICIFNSLKLIDEEKLYDESDLFFHDDIWHSWNHHGDFSDIEKENVLKKINDSQRNAITTLKDSNHILITFGSAFVYELKSKNNIVANCHKVPQQMFNKRLLSVDEIVSAFKKSGLAAKKSQQIFTVSPVRYLGDGLAENNLSKSILIQAIHEIISKNSNCYYFPAYEIVMDELRDYRYFDNDFVHPNKLAIDYVWERFCETFFDEETKIIVDEIRQIVNAKNHKPFNPETKKHAEFLRIFLERTKKINDEFPSLNLENEIRYFENK